MTPEEQFAITKAAVLSGVDRTDSFEVTWMDDDGVEVPREEARQHVVRILGPDGDAVATVYGSGLWEADG